MSIQIMLNKWYNYPDKCAKSKVVINAIQVDIQNFQGVLVWSFISIARLSDT